MFSVSHKQITDKNLINCPQACNKLYWTGQKIKVWQVKTDVFCHWTCTFDVTLFFTLRNLSVYVWDQNIWHNNLYPSDGLILAEYDEVDRKKNSLWRDKVLTFCARADFYIERSVINFHSKASTRNNSYSLSRKRDVSSIGRLFLFYMNLVVRSHSLLVWKDCEAFKSKV